MNWTSTAILSAATQGTVSVIESHLLSKRMPGLKSFLLLVGIVHLIAGLLVLYLSPLPENTPVLLILALVAAIMIRTAGMIIMFHNLKREEVSRVIPIIYTYPVFVAIMAVPLLGESLGYAQWLAIIIVVAGAIIVSAEKSPSGTSGFLSKPFLLLFVASLFFALADILAKYALNYISSWNLFSLSTFIMFAIFISISLRPSTIKQLKEIKRKGSTTALFISSQTLVPIAMTLSFWAISKGPVSLVSTIIATRPVFVAIFSIILGFVLPGFLIRSASREVIALRFIASVMIVGGACIIYLT